LENSREHGDEKFIDVISAKIPKKEREPKLYKVVLQFMVHGPCRNGIKHAPCMSEGIGTKKFPKAFHAEITLDENGYVAYRRRYNDR